MEFSSNRCKRGVWQTGELVTLSSSFRKIQCSDMQHVLSYQKKKACITGRITYASSETGESQQDTPF